MPTGIVTVSQYTAEPPVQIDPASDFEVRGFYTRDFIAGDSVTPIYGNSTSGEQGPYYNVDCSLNGSGNLVVPAHDIQATTLSNPTANYFEGLWVDGAFVMWLMPNTNVASGWQIPTIYGSIIAIDEIALYNRAKRLLFPPDTYPTFDEVILLIQRLAGNFDYAAVGVNGITSMSWPPDLASLPISESQTDPRVASYLSITNYGARVGNTAAQNTTAVTAAKAAASLAGAGIYWPTGYFPINTITVDVPVQFAANGGPKPATGQTTTFTKAILADTSKHFDNALSGQGTISFSGNTSIPYLLAEWWGAKADGSTDCGLAFLARHVAANTASVPLQQRNLTGVYVITSQKLTPYARMSLIGEGSGKTYIAWNGTGYWIDEQIVGPTDFVDRGVLQGLNITVSAAGTGVMRLGDRTTPYTEGHFHDHWEIRDILALGQGVASSKGFDLTSMINLRLDHVIANNFDHNWEFTTLADSTLIKLTSQGGVSKGLYIYNNHPGAVGASMNGTVFIGTVINGLSGTDTGLELEAIQDPSFIGGFIESTSGTATAVKITDSFKVNLKGMSFAPFPGGSFGNVFDITDSGAINLDSCTMSNMADMTSTSSVTWSAANRVLETWGPRGGVNLINCSYSLARQFEGIPWVLSDDASKYPGASANKQPIANQTSLWVKQLLNLQGAQNVSETSLIVDAMHGQVHYDAANTAKIIVDANASVGYGIQTTAGDGYGLTFPYPTEIRPGTYELIGRVRSVSGTSAVSIFVVGLGVGNLIAENPGNATTSYQTFSLRFSFTSGQAGASTAIQAFFQGADPLVIDYVALRPAANDQYLGPYSAPNFQINDSAGGSVNGVRVFSATVMPASGTFDIGDFALNKGIAASGLLGWSRITKGSNNVLGTDWVAIYGVTGLIPGEGAVLTISTNAIAPTNAIHQVGAGLIKTITLPAGFVSGTVALVPTAAFTYDATGNCLGTGTAVVGRTMFATYSPSTSKWSLSY